MESDDNQLAHATTPTPATAAPAPATGGGERKPAVLRSPVWEFFEQCDYVLDGKPRKGAKCSICGNTLVMNGTGHLARHLEMHQKGQAKLNPHQMLLNADAQGNMSTFSYDNKVARKEVVEFVVRSELPFTFVEHNDFKGMIQRAFCPQYRGISATTCKRDIMKWYGEEKKELHAVFEKLDSKICLTSNIGSSWQKMGYMTITAHFIDADWKLNKRIICFKMIEYPHSGEAIATHIYDELLSCRIVNKIFTLSLDNASNNDIAVGILPATLMIPRGLLKDLFHVRCCCYILNLIVQDGLAILGPSIDKITDVVRNMNSSNKRHEMWVAACAEFGMPRRNIDIDVPHRWNSTYLLLHVAIQYKAPLNRYVYNLKATSRYVTLEVPNEEDWRVAQLVCGFLEVFDTSTKIFSVAIEVNEDTDFCILTWWKRHQEHYPILARMARDILTVPASTVASESSFSAGGRIISEKRASLNPSTVQALICLKDWGYAKSRKQDVARLEAESEYWNSVRAARPDWMEDADSTVEVEDEG